MTHATDPHRNESDAGAGGTGAPPPAVERNRAPRGLTRAYENGAIRVLWFAERCVHSAECVKAMPAVFDPRRRPWIVLENADAEAVARAVEACPTGALHYDRLDGGPAERAPADTSVATVRNGPHLLRGQIRVLGPDGAVIREDTRVALCRCGRSSHMPFCDNSHRASGFREPPSSPS